MKGATAPVTDPAAMSRWPVACRQWQGARPYQEDDYDFRVLADEPGGEGSAPALLMVLADGMGGEVGGATASHSVVQAFIHHFPETRGAIGARLNECLDAANRGLHAQVTADPRLDGMGCTVVAAFYDGRSLAWLSVGDSPMWLFTGGRLTRLNADHSMAPVLDRLAEIGELSPEEARSDGKRNMLRSAVMGGTVEFVDCARRSCRLGPDDYLLLASDGLQTVADHDLERWLHVTNGGVEAAADALLSAVQAAAAPGQDNVTFLLLAGAAEAERSTTLVPVPPAPGPAPEPDTGRTKPFFRWSTVGSGLAAALGLAFGLGWWLAPGPEQGPPLPDPRTETPADSTPQPPPEARETLPETPQAEAAEVRSGETGQQAPEQPPVAPAPSGQAADPPSEPDTGTDEPAVAGEPEPQPEEQQTPPESLEAVTAEAKSGETAQPPPETPAPSGQAADPPSEPDAGTDGPGTVAGEPEPEAREPSPETTQAETAEIRSGETGQQAPEQPPVAPTPSGQAADPPSKPDAGTDEPEPQPGARKTLPEAPQAETDGVRSGETGQQAPETPPAALPPMEAPATNVPSTDR